MSVLAHSRRVNVGRLLPLVFALGVLVPGAARTAATPPELWSVNGEVEALAIAGNLLYAGGEFSQVSPRTGPLVALSSRGTPLGSFPRIRTGWVSSIVDDGQGGWFVGGEFEEIGGVRCRHLAHVTSALTVDRRWCPRPSENVTALVRRGSTLYVAGTLQRIGGKRRRTLAALDAQSGRTLAWDPDPGYFVKDIELHGNTLYVIGSFHEISGKRHGYLAAVNATTGKVLDWDPNPPRVGDRSEVAVDTIAVSASHVYAGGSTLLTYDRRTGNRVNWNPVPRGGLGIAALAVSGRRLYVGGSFSRIAGRKRSNLAAFDVATHRLEPWSPRASWVHELSIGADRVYAVNDNRVAVYDAERGRQLRSSIPSANGPISALVPSRRITLVGGNFSGVGGVSRNGLVAFDLRTGRPTSWDPRLSRGASEPSVYSLVVRGRTVYVGGLFTHARGLPRRSLVAVSAVTGKPTSWSPRIDPGSREGAVSSVSASERALFFSGSFEKVDGTPRDTVASVDLATARLNEWHPDVGTAPLVVDGDTVYLGRRSLVAVDSDRGTNIKWQTALEVFRVPNVDAIVVSAGTVYFAGFFESANGSTRQGLAAVNAWTGELTAWNPGTEDLDFAQALAIDGETVYVGSYDGLMAVHRTTGARRGSYPSLTDERVDAIAVRGGRVYVGTEHGLQVVRAAR